MEYKKVIGIILGVVVLLGVLIAIIFACDYFSAEKRVERDVQRARDNYERAKGDQERIENGYGHILLTGGMVFDIP